MITPGVFAKVFAHGSLGHTLNAVADSGLTSVQFNMSLADASSLPPSIPAEVADLIRREFAARNLHMAAVSGTFNMAHPDQRVRAIGCAALLELIAAAPLMGTRIVTLCTGSRDPNNMWKAHPENRSDDAWRDMRKNIEGALVAAEAHDVIIAFEPEPNNVVHNASAGRRLLDEFSSSRLRVVIDPANLVLGAIEQQQTLMQQAFWLLGPDIVLAHAKDVVAGGELVAAGRGLLDYQFYINLLHDSDYEGGLILHGLEPEEVPHSTAFLRKQLSAAFERD